MNADQRGWGSGWWEMVVGGKQVQGPGFRRSMRFCETHRQLAGRSQEHNCSESPIHSSVKYRWLVCSGCYTKTSQSEWLKTMEIDSSQFWRLDIQDRGLICSEAPLAGSQTLPFPYTSMAISVWVHVPLFIKTTIILN